MMIMMMMFIMMMTVQTKQVVFWNDDDAFSHAGCAKSLFRYSGVLIFYSHHGHFYHGREMVVNHVVGSWLGIFLLETIQFANAAGRSGFISLKDGNHFSQISAENRQGRSRTRGLQQFSFSVKFACSQKCYEHFWLFLSVHIPIFCWLDPWSWWVIFFLWGVDFICTYTHVSTLNICWSNLCFGYAITFLCS